MVSPAGHFDQLREEIARAGLTPPHEIIPDGHRKVRLGTGMCPVKGCERFPGDTGDKGKLPE